MIEISKITVSVGDQEIEVSLDELKELYGSLKEFFDEEPVQVIPIPTPTPLPEIPKRPLPFPDEPWNEGPWRRDRDFPYKKGGPTLMCETGGDEVIARFGSCLSVQGVSGE